MCIRDHPGALPRDVPRAAGAERHASRHAPERHPLRGHLQRAHHRRPDPARAPGRFVQAARRGADSQAEPDALWRRRRPRAVRGDQGNRSSPRRSPSRVRSLMKNDVLGSLRLFLALTLLLGLGYPLVVWGIGRVAFREKTDGSFLGKEEGGGRATPVGSALIGQSFLSKKFFHGRPSAAGDAGYDATQSGGTNLGPTSKKLSEAIRDRVAALRLENPEAGASDALPADAVTSSASGLDPHISPEYARLQIPRVARETGIPASRLEALVA